MAGAPPPEILERMLASLAMSEEEMAECTVGVVPSGSDQYSGPMGEECLAPCCQNAPPEERARAARYLGLALTSGPEKSCSAIMLPAELSL